MISRSMDQALLQSLSPAEIGAISTLLATEDQQPIIDKMVALIKKVVDEKIDRTYLPDWLAIYQFLLKPEQVEVYLEAFEAALQKFAAQSPVNAQLKLTAGGSYILPRSKTHPYQSFKLVSGCLYQWAAENGFKQPAKIITALDKDVFFSLLTSRSIFKDTAGNVGYEHGAWSHALQWYIIFEHHQRSHFLQHLPIEVYEHFDALPTKGFAKDEITIWMIILDQLNVNNFTSPEYMTQTIKHMMKREKWPLLYECIHRGWEKMNWKFGTIDRYVDHQAAKHSGDQVNGVIIRKF